MIDMLPFPRISGKTSEEQISELFNYLIQFKETLEFALMNITAENLSPDLINQLNELGANIQNNKDERESALAQITQNQTLTVFDVLNSEAFKASVQNEIKRITFNVNFDTGHLEYAISEQGG